MHTHLYSASRVRSSNHQTRRNQRHTRHTATHSETSNIAGSAVASVNAQPSIQEKNQTAVKEINRLWAAIRQPSAYVPVHRKPFSLQIWNNTPSIDDAIRFEGRLRVNTDRLVQEEAHKLRRGLIGCLLQMRDNNQVVRSANAKMVDQETAINNLNYYYDQARRDFNNDSVYADIDNKRRHIRYLQQEFKSNKDRYKYEKEKLKKINRKTNSLRNVKFTPVACTTTFQDLSSERRYQEGVARAREEFGERNRKKIRKYEEEARQIESKMLRYKQKVEEKQGAIARHEAEIQRLEAQVRVNKQQLNNQLSTISAQINDAERSCSNLERTYTQKLATLLDQLNELVGQWTQDFNKQKSYFQSLFKDDGLFFEKRSQHSDAITCFTKAIKLVPECEVYKLRADSYKALKQYTKAHQDYQSAGREDGKKTVINKMYAEAKELLTQGQSQKAIDLCSQALHLYKSPSFYETRAKAYFNLGEFNNAYTDFRSANNKAGQEEVLNHFNTKANEAATSGNNQAVIDYCSRGLGLNRKHEALLEKRAQAYLNLRRLKSAYLDFGALNNKAAQEAIINQLDTEADNFINAKDYQAAINLCLLGLRIDRANITLNSRCAQSYCLAKNYRSGFYYYDQANHQAGMDFVLNKLYQEGLNHAQRGNHSSAIETYDLGLEIIPYDRFETEKRNFNLKKADSLSALGNRSAAYRAYSSSGSAAGKARMLKGILDSRIPSYHKLLLGEEQLYQAIRNRWYELKKGKSGQKEESAVFDYLRRIREEEMSKYSVGEDGIFRTEGDRYLQRIRSAQEIMFHHLVEKHSRSPLKSLIQKVKRIAREHNLPERTYLDLQRSSYKQRTKASFKNFQQRAVGKKSKFIQELEELCVERVPIAMPYYPQATTYRHEPTTPARWR